MAAVGTIGKAPGEQSCILSIHTLASHKKVLTMEFSTDDPSVALGIGHREHQKTRSTHDAFQATQ